MSQSTNWGYKDSREVDIISIRNTTNRVDNVVKFSDGALKRLVKVPHPFLKFSLNECVACTKENKCILITEKETAIIIDKRFKENEIGYF